MAWGQITIDKRSGTHQTQGYEMTRSQASQPISRTGRAVNSLAKGRTAGDRSRHAAIDSPCDPAKEAASALPVELRLISKSIPHASLQQEGPHNPTTEQQDARTDTLASKDDDVGDVSQWLVEQPSLEGGIVTR